MSDPIQPKVKTYRDYRGDLATQGLGASLEHTTEYMLDSHERLISDLNKEILELREEIEKLKHPEVTIHTPRYKPPFTSDSSGNLGTGYC